MWKTVTVSDATVGFRLVSEDGNASNGSAVFMDSVFNNTKQAIIIAPPAAKPGSGTTGLVLDNVSLRGVGAAVVDTSGNVLLQGGNGAESWVLGPIYNDTVRTWTAGDSRDQLRDVTLVGKSAGGLPNAPYFERARPQYETASPDDFVHLKDLGAKGDGATDDTAAVQAALDNNKGKIIFADAGVYLLTDTVVVPAGTRLLGEAWTQFAATGDKFSNTE